MFIIQDTFKHVCAYFSLVTMSNFLSRFGPSTQDVAHHTNFRPTSLFKARFTKVGPGVRVFPEQNHLNLSC